MDVYVYLTGTPDSLPDIATPCSSVSVSLNDAAESYGSFTVPADETYSLIADIAARPNGEIVIELDGSEIYRANFDSISYSIGNSSANASLRASHTFTNSTPATVVIDSPIVAKGINSLGERYYQIGEYFPIVAGDTVTIDGDSWTCRNVQFSFSPTSFSQRITELLP